MFSQKAMFSLKGMHFTTRNDLHYGQWFQQKGADSSDHGLLASSSTLGTLPRLIVE